MIWRTATATAVLATVSVAAPAAASTSQMVVSIEDRAVVSRTGAATVPVTVTCSFQMATSQTSGTLTVTVVQAAGSGDVTGTGAVPLTCDGVTRTYAVTATPTSGAFRPGTLTVQARGDAEGTFEQEICVSHPDGTVECDTYQGREVLDGSDGPEPVKATGVR